MTNSDRHIISSKDLTKLVMEAVIAGFNSSGEGGNGDYDRLPEKSRKKQLKEIARKILTK